VLQLIFLSNSNLSVFRLVNLSGVPLTGIWISKYTNSATNSIEPGLTAQKCMLAWFYTGDKADHSGSSRLRVKKWKEHQTNSSYTIHTITSYNINTTTCNWNLKKASNNFLWTFWLFYTLCKQEQDDRPSSIYIFLAVFSRLY
jgi:hypothetical protein